MKKNTKHRIEKILKYTWLTASVVLLGQGIYYATLHGLQPAAKFFLLSVISFLFFLRRHYFSK